MTDAFFGISVFGAVWVLNAFFPRKNPLVLLASFFGAWLTIELAPWLLLWEIVAVSWFVAGGAVVGTRGWVALGLSIASAVGLVVIILRSRRTQVILRDGFGDLDIGDAPPFPRWQVLFPFFARRRRGVTT